ncbi:hypothetical protein EHP00_1932 [Ecytonucleospora hepatopenaei]|uniref:Uncharacterized protein n=1 Tax=Ecytonucleospora hepatopenaei TaxID=646526 RepID=A0A1W0E3Q6_9MICR|nr:hypothetical protein EHP00_1932 [Ecytonucleospora hepatopenaei]
MTNFDSYSNHSNNMAMLLNRITPGKFSNSKQTDPENFINSMNSYIKVVGLSSENAVLFFKMSLEGDAAVWLQSLDDSVVYEELAYKFKERWCRKNKVLSAINRLNEIKLDDFTDYLCLLDLVKSVGLSGNLPEDVMIASVLRILPESLSEKLLSSGGELTMNSFITIFLMLKLDMELLLILASILLIILKIFLRRKDFVYFVERMVILLIFVLN